MNSVKPKNNWSILTSLKSRLKNPSDVNILAKYCLAISKSYLRSKFDNIYKLEYYEQYSLDEIALDAVVPLFEKNQEDLEFVIIRSFKNWRKPIENDDQADYFMHKVVWDRTEQQITKVYKEIDPFFAKIYDSIKYLTKIGGFCKISYFGQNLIVKYRNVILNQIIDKDNFNQIPTHVFSGNKQNLLKNIFNYLDESTEFSIAIPINLLVKRIKLLRINDYAQSEIAEAEDIFDDSFNVDNIVKIGLEKTYIKLDKIYGVTEKFSSLECSQFRDILINFTADLTNGGIKKSNYEYYLEVNPNLSSEDFYSKYQNTIYYLMSELKKNISEKLKFEYK